MNLSVADRLASDIDPDLLSCLRTQVNSFIKWDLVHFFHRNPYTTDTSEGIARHLGRNAEAIRSELAEMAAEGILVERCYSDMTVYSFSDDPAIRDLIRRLVEASGDRLFRAKAAYYMIRAMRSAESASATSASDNGECSEESREESLVVGT